MSVQPGTTGRLATVAVVVEYVAVLVGGGAVAVTVVVDTAVVVATALVVGATVVVDTAVVVATALVVGATVVLGAAVVVGASSVSTRSRSASNSAESLPPEQPEVTRTIANPAASHRLIAEVSHLSPGGGR